ncbi:MAG: tRNA (adenosine(37)-N6)-dimethylallyltransferase MiaA [Armatimonadetes bacterium]|nr:tRNA (adenosine(37)-N6)-dimethylallyltransferase MiaA [Armatimonadota bacterium]
MGRPRVLCLLGPTAVGKTAVAVALAPLLSAEYICADSRQIYRGLAVGSAAPTPAEQALAPHHLVGFLDPRAAYSVAEFVHAAESTAWDILRRGRTPVVVAGTGLYVKALVTGWSLTSVPANDVVRARLEAEAAEHGGPTLHQRLAQVDPDTAARIAPADTKRVVRALEVFEVSGMPLSEHHRQSGTRPVPFDYRLVGLRRDRAALYARVEQRVDQMLAEGWLDEVRALLASGLTGGEPAFEGLGYRALAAVVRGEADLESATAGIKQDTRRFAKRQMTWYRAMPGIEWLDVDHLTPDATAARVAESWAG